MSDISPEVIDKMMVKCGRRCCICKRYRPTKLQVHHIHEKAKGGSDEEDNLIVTCFSCHSDVHTHVPFARRFSQGELKSHRDTLVRQVADGVFPDSDVDDADLVIRQILQGLRDKARHLPRLTDYASEILLRAVDSPGVFQGDIIYSRSSEGTSIQINGENLLSNPKDNRLIAAYKNGLEQLMKYGLLDTRSGKIYEVTYDGYLLADELKARGAEAITE